MSSNDPMSSNDKKKIDPVSSNQKKIDPMSSNQKKFDPVYAEKPFQTS